MNNMSAQKKTILLIFTVIILVAVYLAYITTKNSFNFRNVNDFFGTGEKELVKDGKPTGAFYETIKEATYSDIKSQAGDLVTSPNIQDQDTRAQVDKNIPEDQIQNVAVLFTNDGLNTDHVVIYQGDLVTWHNESGRNIEISGQDWGSALPVEPGNAFSQRFDFLGVYEYSVNGNIQARVEVMSR